jgi:hypothetical protein
MVWTRARAWCSNYFGVHLWSGERGLALLTQTQHRQHH